MAGLVLHREVDVDSAPSPVGHWFPEKCQVIAPLGGDLLGHHLEEKGVVGGLQGLVVAERQLELAVVVLRVDRLQLDAHVVSGVHDLLDGAAWVDGGPGPVHIGTRGVDRLPPPAPVGLEQERLQLESDLWAVAQIVPVGDDSLEDRARSQFHRRGVLRDRGDDHPGARLPTRSDGLHREAGLDIGETLVMRSGEGLHHPVELQGEERHAVVASLLGARCGEVLAPGEAEMVRPKESNTVIGCVCQASLLLSSFDTRLRRTVPTGGHSLQSGECRGRPWSRVLRGSH